MPLKVTFQDFSNTKPLIILDLANNHNGLVEHGKRIIDEVVEAKRQSKIDLQIAIKFQYRDLPNFIDAQFRNRRDIKYIDRFLSTKLNWEEFLQLKLYAQDKGLLTACTPFDEFSVEKVLEHDYDILKIASASFTDWPLLESIMTWERPIVASTAGVSISEIDRVVTFLSNRKKEFALMHCVASYPTIDQELLLNRIGAIKERYQKIPVGYSTHENPNNFVAGCLALAAGAIILERHIGSAVGGQKINNYSSERNQLVTWFDSLAEAAGMLGSNRPFTVVNNNEIASIKDLRRYAFAKRDLSKGESFGSSNVYYAIPGSENQFQANDFGKYAKFVAKTDIKMGEAIIKENVDSQVNENIVYSIRHDILRLIEDSGVIVPSNSELEISHHYGIDQFRNFGCSMITVVNRDYCKKLIFLLPGQVHPEMYHKIKDESFFILYGEISLQLDGQVQSLAEGDTVVIAPGATHGFSSKTGAVIEEVSTNHKGSDSFYLDDSITANKNRKTIVHYWL